MRPLHASAHLATWVVVFAAALLAGVALHLGHPVARRLVAAGVNSALAPILAGRVVVDRVGALALTSLNDVDAHVDGPDGRPVLRVEGVRAKISTWALVRRLLGGRKQIAIFVPELSMSRVDLSLDSDETGAVRIARAFTSRSQASPNETGAELRLHLKHVHIDHAMVRFEPSAPIDGDVDDLDASLDIDKGVVTVDVPAAKVTVRGLPNELLARGAVQVHLTTPKLRTRVHWDGDVAAVHQTADVSYDDGHVDAVADVGRTSPEDLRAICSQCSFSGATALHAEAHGTLPHLDVKAQASVGGGKLEVVGTLDWDVVKRAALRVKADALDLHALAAGAPTSDLSASGDVTLEAEPDWRVAGHAALSVDEGRAGAYRVPPATIQGDVRLPPGGLPTASAEITVREPGAPSTIAIRLEPRHSALTLAFEADVTAPHLQHIACIPELPEGSAHARASGTVDLGAGTFSASASADASDLHRSGLAIDHGHVEVRAGGRLNAPSADVEATASDVTLGPAHVASLRVAGKVGVEPSQGGSAPTIAIRDVEVEVGAGEAPASARASSVRVAPDGVRVEDAVVEGFGAPLAATIHFSSGEVSVHAKSAGLDLAQVAELVGLHDFGGTAAVDIDATVSSGAASGRLVLDLTRASAYAVHDANGHVEAKVRGRRIWGRATGSIGDIGTLQARASGVQIGPGSLVTAGPWRKTFGSLDVSARIDLARLAAHLPAGLNPFASVGGILEVTSRVERDDVNDVTPGVDLALHTEGLELVEGPAGGGWRVQGLDPTVHVMVDADTGDTAIQAEVHDSSGALVSVHATSGAVPYAALFSDENPAGAFRAMTFDAEVAVPSRAVAQLPPALRPAGLAGVLGGTLAWHGSALRPSFQTTLELNGSGAGVMTSPVDLELQARYDGAKLEATLQGKARKAKVLDASATVDLAAADVLAGRVDAWKASARAKLDRLPLRALGWLRDRQIRGTASGEVVLDGFHDDARLRGDVSFTSLQLGDIPCKDASAKITFDGKALDGLVRLAHADGFMEARAHAGARWGRALVPTIDPTQAAQASFVAKQFRAAVLLPFLGAAITQLDGSIDADAHVEVDADARAVRPHGEIALRGGTLELATFGNEFHDVTATLKATPDGVIRLEDAVAHGLSGTVQAAATARFEGLVFSGLRANIRMPAKDPLPIVFDGVQAGAIDGEFDIDMARVASGWNIDVAIAAAHVELPSGSRSLNVQSLGDVEGVQVGVQGRSGEFVPVSLDSAHDEPIDRASARKSPLKVAIKLGRNVHVSRGSDLNVRLEGQPTLTLTDEMAVAGQVRLASGGTIGVQGKQFEIESGAITFAGSDPSNPQVVLTAGWQASDGETWVYADFVGPLKTAQVKLRSSPPKSQNEVLAILLYGSSDDATNSLNAGTGTNYDLSAASPFTAVAGGAATQQLNQALGGVNRALDKMGLVGGISTKVDTSQATPRPEVEVQIARDISLQVAWVIGAVTLTNPDTTLLTLDWHFLRKWFLETSVGDAGTSVLNVVWQHRY